MKFKFFTKNRIFLTIFQATLITTVVLLSVCQFSCKSDEDSVSIISGDYLCPTLEDFCAKSCDEIQLSFSQEVSLSDVNISPDIGMCAMDYEDTEEINSLFNVKLKLPQKMQVGQLYSVYGIALDLKGNSLTFCVPILGYNENIPRLEITEVHAHYKGESSGDGKFLCEYVELRALSSGNLLGTELYSAYDGDQKIFKMPSADVKNGEIIIVHLRSMGSGCISELEDDLTLSKAFTSSDKARDIWVKNEKPRLGDESDVILLRDTMHNKILDAVAYAKPSVTELKNTDFENAIRSAIDEGVWEGEANISSFANADKLSATRSLIRTSNKHNKSAWIVSDSGKYTPGDAYGANSTSNNGNTNSSGNSSSGSTTGNGSTSGGNTNAGGETGGSSTNKPDNPSASIEDSKLPRLEITEAQIKYTSKNKDGAPACEFVELRALSSGNLFGLEIFSASDGAKKVYKFPSIEVKNGEIIVVHLRSVGEGCINELESNLNLSSAVYSAKNVRDLWAENTSEARLNDNADVILLRSSSSQKIFDALLYSKSSNTEWKDSLKDFAQSAVDAKIWSPNSSIGSAANIDGTTYEKSLQRTASKNCASSWSAGVPTPGVVSY